MPIDSFVKCNNEARFSELLFSQLTAGWYDWTVSNYLRLNHTHCWSTTAAYYAIYILAGSLVYLPLNQVNRNYLQLAKSHDRLQKFYSGDNNSRYTNDLYLRRSFSKDLAASLDIPPNEVDITLKELGEILGICKKARENHTYEVLVVAHQALDSVNSYKPQSTVEDINIKCLALVEHVNKIIGGLVLKFLLKYDLVWRGYHFRHLIEEIDQFKVLLDYENIITGLPKPLLQFHDEIKVSLNSVLQAQDHKVDNRMWQDFEFNLNMFKEKGESYDRLYKTQRELSDFLYSSEIKIHETDK